MAKMMTKFDILSKNVMGCGLKSLNVVGIGGETSTKHNVKHCIMRK